jgi:hypothetical protein
MDFSIKSPKALLWKTGYKAAQLKDLYEADKLIADWLVCPHGDSAAAVTIAEFVEDPSILRKSKDAQLEPLTLVSKKNLMSVAAMGWWVFFGALFVYVLISLIAKEAIFNSAGDLGRPSETYVVIAILLKGLDALIIAGAITALLGHAYTKIAEKLERCAE